MKSPHVTVAIPVKDRRERMLRCLEAVLVQEYGSYDVLVLDNGSSDGTVEACRARAESAGVPVRVEVIEGSVGRVRNVGAGLAAGELVAFTDSDCAPAPSWIAEGVKPFEDPAVGLVVGMTLPEPGVARRGWDATLEVTGQTWRFESANLFVRREPFLATEGFAEETGHFSEDTVAGWAMLSAGWRAEFAGPALVHHDVTFPPYTWHLQRAYKYGKVAAVVRRFPEARDVLLWRRYFLRPRNAAFAAALIGVLAAPVNRRALLLALPYARMRNPGRPTPGALFDLGKCVGLDACVLAGMVSGSIRWRRLVL